MSGIVIDPSSLAIATSIGILTHLLFFTSNHLLARLLKLGGPDPQQGQEIDP